VENRSGGPFIVAALILGVAVLAAGFLVRSSLDAGTEELAGVREALGEVQAVLEDATGNGGGRAEARPQRPDPGERHEVALDGAPVRGPQGAKITIVEFGDFQCPTCAQIYPTLKKLMADRKDVRIVFKDLPLVGKHDWAYAAAVAGQCAFQQSPEAFWAVHDYFFENQAKLNARNLDAQLDAFAARRAGLDAAQFRACRQDKATAHRVDASLREAAALGLVNTPTLLVNGRPLVGNQPREIIERLINFEVALHEAQKQQQGSAPR